MASAVHGQSYADAHCDANLIPAYPAPVSGLFGIALLHTAIKFARGTTPMRPVVKGG